MWIIYCLSAALIWAIVNFIDKYIVDNIAEGKQVESLILFSAIAGVPVVILIPLIKGISEINLPINDILALIIAGIFYLCGIIPYLYSIKHEEVSSVVPQFLLVPFVGGILSFLFYQETLTILQLTGGLLILSGSLLLSSNLKLNYKNIKFNPHLFYLYLLTAIFFSLNSLIFKYHVKTEVNFWGGLFWEHIGFVIFAISIFFIKSYRTNFLQILKYKGNLAIFLNITGEIITLIGNFFFHFSILFVPISLAQIMSEGTQPVFAIILGILGSLLLPKIIKENIDLTIITKKAGIISIMILGAYLVI